MDPKRRPAWSPFFNTECAVAAHSRPSLCITSIVITTTKHLSKPMKTILVLVSLALFFTGSEAQVFANKIAELTSNRVLAGHSTTITGNYVAQGQSLFDLDDLQLFFTKEGGIDVKARRKSDKKPMVDKWRYEKKGRILTITRNGFPSTCLVGDESLFCEFLGFTFPVQFFDNGTARFVDGTVKRYSKKSYPGVDVFRVNDGPDWEGYYAIGPDGMIYFSVTPLIYTPTEGR
jgi:hypothetical protein